MKIIKILTSIMALMLLLCGQGAIVEAAELPEPSENFYVLDNANVLDQETIDHIMKVNDEIYEQYEVQFVVVTVDFVNDMSLEDFAYQLFNKWQIGGKQNRGILLVLDIGDDDYWILQGKGLEKTLTSKYLGDVLYEYLENDFADKTYGAGVVKTMDAIQMKLDKSFKEKPVKTEDIKEESIGSVFGGFVVTVLFIYGGWKYYQHRKNKKQNQSSHTTPTFSGQHPYAEDADKNLDVRMEKLRQKEKELNEREARLRKEEYERQKRDDNDNEMLKGFIFGQMLGNNHMNHTDTSFGHDQQSNHKPSHSWNNNSSSTHSSTSFGSSSSSVSHHSAPSSGQGGSSRGGGAGRRS